MELKEKWGLREGWCWDDDVNKAQECLLVLSSIGSKYNYHCKIDGNDIIWYKNFSETDPNKEELKVGEFAYFWDEGWLVQEFLVFSKLSSILDGKINKYVTTDSTCYKFCSHINPLLK